MPVRCRCSKFGAIEKGDGGNAKKFMEGPIPHLLVEWYGKGVQSVSLFRFRVKCLTRKM